MTLDRKNIFGHFALLFLLLGVLGLALSCATTSAREDGTEGSGAALSDSAGANEVAFQDSDIIPIMRSPMMGAMSAKVTIVAFSDFQCPYCRKAAGTLAQIFKTFPEDTKIVFKQFPLSFHPQAEAGARASIAAGKQGKFWEMHDWLFENQDNFRAHADDFEAWTAGYAKMLSLDVERFQRDFHAAETTQIIERDAALAEKLNVSGTPAFFINGERLTGAQPFEVFATLVEAKRAQADALIAGGDTPPNLYATLVAKNYQQNPRLVQGPAMKDEPADNPAEGEVVHFDTSELSVHPGQVRGPMDAKVTIFAFEDFQCPYCARADVNLKEALAQVDDSVRVVFKHMPLAFHPQALPAAKAAVAAREQGKFWQMHDLLFARQADLETEGIYLELAESLGLDLKKFKADMADKTFEAQIAADFAQAQALGFRGTPTFVINGVAVVGAQPSESFVRVIREALSQKQ